jgi:hypothetical protein
MRFDVCFNLFNTYTRWFCRAASSSEGADKVSNTFTKNDISSVPRVFPSWMIRLRPFQGYATAATSSSMRQIPFDGTMGPFTAGTVHI